MTPLSRQELDEADALLLKVTRGPWEAKLMDEIYPKAKERIGTWKEGAWGCVGPSPAGSEADAKFKAWARNNVPRPLHDLRAARGNLKKYGKHETLCAVVGGYDQGCTCGLDAAMGGERG